MTRTLTAAAGTAGTAGTVGTVWGACPRCRQTRRYYPAGPDGGVCSPCRWHLTNDYEAVYRAALAALAAGARRPVPGLHIAHDGGWQCPIPTVLEAAGVRAEDWWAGSLWDDVEVQDTLLVLDTSDGFRAPTVLAFLTLDPLGPVEHERRLHTPRWRAARLKAQHVISLTDPGADDAVAELAERVTVPRVTGPRPGGRQRGKRR